MPTDDSISWYSSLSFSAQHVHGALLQQSRKKSYTIVVELNYFKSHTKSLHGNVLGLGFFPSNS